MLAFATLFSLLLAGRPPSCPPKEQTGYIKNQDGEYLSCTNQNCQFGSFEATTTPLFKQQPGLWNTGQSQFAMFTPTMAPTGQCLNFYRSNDQLSLRMADCNIHGSNRWLLCNGILAYGGMWGCIQEDAKINYCVDSYASVSMVAPKCALAGITVDNLKCKSPMTGGGCASSGFDSGSMRGASAQNECNACDAAKGSTQSCSFSFGYTTTQQITNTWSNSETNSFSVSFSLEEDFFFLKATEGFSYTFSHTLTTGRSTTQSYTVEDTTACSVELAPGTKETATAQYLVGTIEADFTGTVTKHYACNTGVKNQTATEEDMTLTITNVPTAKIIGSCTTQAGTCPSLVESRLSRALKKLKYDE